MSDEVWGYSDNPDGEDGWAEAFATREEAIRFGRGHFGRDPFWICKGVRPKASDFTHVDLEWLTDAMRDNAFDEAGDVVDDWPDPSSEAQKELKAIIDAWADKHCKPDFWIADAQSERIEPFDPPKAEAQSAP